LRSLPIQPIVPRVGDGSTGPPRRRKSSTTGALGHSHAQLNRCLLALPVLDRFTVGGIPFA